MLHTSDFDFELPTDLIASHPLERRDASRMLVVRSSPLARGVAGSTRRGVVLSDKHIRDFLDYLQPGDVVVFNNSRVIPARFDADGHEITLHTAVDDKNWWGLCKKFNKINIGDTLTMTDGTTITVADKDDESGLLLRFNCENVFDVLAHVGKMPLPPYMKRKAEIADQTRYQTVYADPLGSMAAPTAGLHFTDELMTEIEKRGAKIVKITLHVGAGTWMPVKTENLAEHKMHSEWCQITPEQADIINNATRVIAVGTTTLRTLESAALSSPPLEGCPQGASVNDARCGGGLCQPYDMMGGQIDIHHQYRSEKMKIFSASMRQHMTDAEKKLWYSINNKKLGFQFRRQYIIDNMYIADFVCLEKKLVIEVDGSQHFENKNDEKRTQYLQQFGFNVVRFWNWDINENLDGCVQVIVDILTNNSFERRLAEFKDKFGPAPGSTGVSHCLADPAARAGLGPNKKNIAPNPALAAGSQSASVNDARCGGGLCQPRHCGGVAERAQPCNAMRGRVGPRVAPFCGTTDIFITPGYKFRVVDVLLTNFHLPKSTLFMLVSAFSGLDEMKAAYAHAVAEKYRFFSYGDCCLLFRKDD